MFSNSSDIVSFISRNTNILYCNVKLDNNTYEIDLDTKFFSSRVYLENNDSLESNLNICLGHIDFISKLNSIIKTNSLLDLTFAYSSSDSLTMNDFKSFYINMSGNSIDSFIIKDNYLDILEELKSCYNLIELLDKLKKHSILYIQNGSSDENRYSLLFSGMCTLEDVVFTIKSNRKGKIQAKALCLMANLSLLALIDLNISLDRKEVLVKLVDNRIIDSDTGNVIDDKCSLDFITKRVEQHIYNNM